MTVSRARSPKGRDLSFSGQSTLKAPEAQLINNLSKEFGLPFPLSIKGQPRERSENILKALVSLTQILRILQSL